MVTLRLAGGVRQSLNKDLHRLLTGLCFGFARSRAVDGASDRQ